MASGKLMNNRPWGILALVCYVSITLAACRAAATPSPEPMKVMALTALPSPIYEGPISLEEALGERRSVREFDDTPLTNLELGQLLWALQGETDERGFRTAPSAGALYPLEVYVVTSQGIHHYVPDVHSLETLGGEDARQRLYHAALDQEAVRQAPAVFVVAAEYERTAQKYGAERSPRYVHMEAGHAAQNLLLQAVALDLGAVPIGAFHDEQVQQALDLPPEYEPLYLIPVGHSRRDTP